MITRAGDSARDEFDPYEAPLADSARFWKELSNISWWRRQRAHTEIVRRGGHMLTEATRRLANAI